MLRYRGSEGGTRCQHNRRCSVCGVARSDRRRGTSSYGYGRGRLRSERPHPKSDGTRGVHGGRLPERSCTPSDRQSRAHRRGDRLPRRAASTHWSGRGRRQSPLADGGRRGSAAETGQDEHCRTRAGVWSGDGGRWSGTTHATSDYRGGSRVLRGAFRSSSTDVTHTSQVSSGACRDHHRGRGCSSLRSSPCSPEWLVGKATNVGCAQPA